MIFKNQMAILFWIIFLLFGNSAQALTYPKISHSNVVETRFGMTLNDNYRKLESLDLTSVQNWAEAENKLTRSIFDESKNRNFYLQRFSELTKKEILYAPILYGNKWFYQRKPKGKNRFVVSWKAIDSSNEKIIFNANELPENKNMVDYYFSKSGKVSAFMIAKNSESKVEITFRDVDTGQNIESWSCLNNIPLEISPDDQGVYYNNGYDQNINFHRFGTNQQNDKVLSLGNNIPKDGYIKSLTVSRDRKWILVSLIAWNINQNTQGKRYLFVKNIKSDTDFQLIHKETIFSSFLKYTFEEYNDIFYVTSQESAPNGKVISLNMRSKNIGWRDYIPENKQMALADISIFKGSLFLNYLQNASSKILIKNLSSGITSEARLPSNGVATTPTPSFPYYKFETIFQPSTTYTVGEKDLQPKIYFSDNYGFDPSKFKIQQIFYPSKDGTKVSMFIVSKTDMKFDQNTPFLLEGYGGFSVPMLANFNLAIIPWLEAGGAYALMNLRGGSEYGNSWYKAGILEKKQNVFDDAIAAADYLIKNKYTRASKLAIKGGSNGGLLVGAVVTQRPDLFKAAISENPVLDMIRFPKFGSGKDWFPDYGDPQNEKDFKYLLSYSPYHNISPTQNYPAILFTGAFEDEIVTPIHAMKMAAALQEVTATTNPILLSLRKNQGHYAILIEDWIENTADMFGFLMDQLF